MYRQFLNSNSSPILELSVKFLSQICHENINKPLVGAYLADFCIDISLRGRYAAGIGQLGSPVSWRRVISSTVPLPIYHDIFLKDGQIAHKFHDSIAWRWRYSNNDYHLCHSSFKRKISVNENLLGSGTMVDGAAIGSSRVKMFIWVKSLMANSVKNIFKVPGGFR